MDYLYGVLGLTLVFTICLAPIISKHMLEPEEPEEPQKAEEKAKPEEPEA